jgi:hypothetical protein
MAKPSGRFFKWPIHKKKKKKLQTEPDDCVQSQGLLPRNGSANVVFWGQVLPDGGGRE